MATIGVRQVTTPQDLQSFKAMTLRYLEWLAVDLCFQGIDEELAGLPGCYAADAGGCMLLALEGGGEGEGEGEGAAHLVVGAVAVRALPAGAYGGGGGGGGGGVADGVPLAATCEMKRLFVLPECQGRGAGTALVQAAVAEARKLGYRAMVLDTLDRLAAANRLYRAQGFQPCEPYNHCPLPGVLYFVKRWD